MSAENVIILGRPIIKEWRKQNILYQICLLTIFFLCNKPEKISINYKNNYYTK